MIFGGSTAQVWYFAIVFALIPLGAYCAVALCNLGFLSMLPPENLQGYQDVPQNAALTLAGFAFTALTVLLTHFEVALAAKQLGPQVSVFLFACSLVSFTISYMLLRFRTSMGVFYFADACTDTGFWCSAGGFLVLCVAADLGVLSALLLFLVAAVGAYLGYNLYCYTIYARKIVH